MPPWHIDKNDRHPKYKNDPSLSDDEIATIVKWAMAARREATRPTCRRRARSPTCNEWQIGKPDLVIKYPGVHDAGRRARICSASCTRDVPNDGRIATSRPSRRAPSTPLAQGRSPRAVVCR